MKKGATETQVSMWLSKSLVDRAQDLVQLLEGSDDFAGLPVRRPH